MRLELPDTTVYDHIIVHCAATPPSLDIDAEWIDRIHREKGWSGGNGYNFFIPRDGRLEWEGSGHRARKLGTVGAHVGGCGPGWNKRSIGICMAGGVAEDGVTPENNYTEAQLNTLWQLIYELRMHYQILPINIIGHRDLIKRTNAAPKACPCFSVQAWMETRERTSTGQQTDVEQVLDIMDLLRSVFNWLRSERPSVPNSDPLKVHKTYTVKSGDTLWSISNTYGVPVTKLRSLNALSSDMLQIGQELRLLD